MKQQLRANVSRSFNSNSKLSLWNSLYFKYSISCMTLLKANFTSFQTILYREYWMIYGGQGFLSIAWSGSLPSPSTPSESSTGNTQEDWERDTSRVPSKQTKINFGSNQNKPKQDLFCVCFGLFRETKNKNFWFVSVFRTYTKTTETNRTVS